MKFSTDKRTEFKTWMQKRPTAPAITKVELWGFLHQFMAETHKDCQWLYADDVNDDHIETMLRATMRELNIQIA